jgi:hypothetical protein
LIRHIDRTACSIHAAKLPKKAPDFRKLDVFHPAIFEAVQVRQQALAMQLTNATIRKLLKKED